MIYGIEGDARVAVRHTGDLAWGPFMSRKGLLMKRTNVINSGAGVLTAKLRLDLEAHYNLQALFKEKALDAIPWLDARGGFKAHPVYDRLESDQWGLPVPVNHCALIVTDSPTTALLFKLTFGGC